MPSHVYNDPSSCRSDIDRFYDDIFECIKEATSVCIATSKHNTSNYHVPGWNSYVSEKHKVARSAYLMWRDGGKQHCGYYFENMKLSRARFKLALRYCKDISEEMKANACAEGLLVTDPHKFWTNVNKISNSKANVHVASVGGASGKQDVADMWKNHFEKLYNSKKGQ